MSSQVAPASVLAFLNQLFSMFDHAYRIEVQDSGAGIADADQQRLFVEFQQLDAGADKRHAGTGLGLALVRRLAEAQGGTVGVESRLGHGSTFSVTLPRRGGVQEGDAAGAVQRAGGQGPRILVVEDSARDRELVVTALAEAGYAVDTAATVSQALVRARARPYDALVLDILLPDGTGLDALTVLRAGGINAKTPVVVVSQVPDSPTMRAHAVDDWLTKPLRPEALVATLSRVLAGQNQQAPVMVVDDEPAALRLMESTLHRLGYRALCVGDPRVALAEVAARPIAAIVLDLLMPDMDGFAFLDHLRAQPGTREVPVIVWTAHDLTTRMRQRLAGGTSGVVGKSDLGRLVSELRRVLVKAGGHGD